MDFCRAGGGVGLNFLCAPADESECSNPASPAWPLFAKQHSPKCAQSGARRRTHLPRPRQMFPFCSRLPSPPLPPGPRIPLTPAEDCLPAALNVGWALLFSLQMRSDICTRLSQRVSTARGHRPIDRARPRGRRARRHPKLP